MDYNHLNDNYSNQRNLLSPENSEESENFVCPICIDEFEDKKDKFKCDQCTQEICIYCFSKWRKSCPLCQKEYPVSDSEQDLEQQHELPAACCYHNEAHERIRYCNYRRLLEILCILGVFLIFFYLVFPRLNLIDDGNNDNGSNFNTTHLESNSTISSSKLHTQYIH